VVLGALLGGPHVAIGSLFDGLMALHHSHSIFGHRGFLGGPNVAIGKLFYRLMANSHSHSFWPWRLFSPWFSSSHVPWPSHLLTHSTPTGQPVLHSHQALTWHQDWTWLGLCASWFALFHLPPPSHSLTLTTLTGLRLCFACIKSSPFINNGLGLVGFVPIFA